MKKTIISLFSICLLSAQTLLAQEPRPDWVRQPPNPPAGANFILVYGMGTGKTEKEAEIGAWKNAFFKALNAGGLVAIQAQKKTLDEVLTMNDLETMIPAHVLPRHMVCQTQPIYVMKDEVKVYVLLQVQRHGGMRNDFYDYDLKIDCESTGFKQSLENWNRKEAERQKKVRKRISREVKWEEIISGNSYLGWSIVDGGYPLNLGTSFIGRFGGTIGIGFQFGVGLDFGGESTYLEDEPGSNTSTTINYLSYNAGLRLYPYKNIYLSANYGTLGSKKISTFNDSEGRFGTEGWRQGKGISVMAGYDLIPGSKFGHSGFLLSVSAGMAYDLFLTKWSPMVNLKIGYAWSISE
jgi:hypothetical protein